MIVVGFVRTPEGRAALAAGIEEAKRRGATLVVSHVGSGPDDTDDLKDLRPQLEEGGVPFEIRTDYAGLSPADHLVNLAESTDAVLVVIGLRRRSAVGKLILGSNAQRILLGAPCPVLTVKAR